MTNHIEYLYLYYDNFLFSRVLPLLAGRGIGLIKNVKTLYFDFNALAGFGSKCCLQCLQALGVCCLLE